MWHIRPIPYEEAQGPLREAYDEDLKSDGYVTNTFRAWSYRPEVLVLYRQFTKAIRSHLRLRTYELAVLSAARAMGCVY